MDRRYRERLLADYPDIVKREWPKPGFTLNRAITACRFARSEREKTAAAETVPVVEYGDACSWLAEQDDCDLLLTDPPYSTDVPDVQMFASEWLPLALKKVKPAGRAYVCIGAYPAELRAYLSVPAPDLTLANVLVWTYRNTLGPSPGLDYKLNWQAILYYRGPDAPPLDSPKMTEQFSVADINAPDGRLGDRLDAWQKPAELAERFVRHATKPGQLVLDPFAGTGTFLVEAARLRIVTECGSLPGWAPCWRPRPGETYPRDANRLFLAAWHHGSMAARRAPSGLGTAGRALWRAVNAEFGLAPHESAILVQCCRVVDRLDAIEAELAGAPLTVEGSTGQPRAHPLLAEWRMQARVLESLSRALSIPLPGEDVGRRRSPSAREAAVARWGRGGVA